MAAPAETLHTRGNSSVFDNALLHWLASGGEQFKEAMQSLQQFPDRIAYQLNPDKPRIPQFNVYRLQVRWEELIKTSETKEVALQKLIALAQEDFRTFIEEYVLRKNISTFTLKIILRHGHHIITDEYSTPLLTMAKEAVKDFIKQGKPASRMEADSVAIAKMMDWAAQGQDGDIEINISPAGGSYLGPTMYSFIFIRILHILPNGDREIHTTQHKVWLSHMNLLRLLQQCGAPVPPGTLATELSLTKLFLPLPQGFDQKKLTEIALTLPQQHIPPEYEEVSLQNSEGFQQEYESVETFFLTLVEKAFQTAPQTHMWKKLEEAINFGQRRLLKVIQDDKKGAIDVVSTQRLLQLFETYSDHVYGNKKLDARSAVAVTTQLTGVLGSLGRMTSMGQCLGGSLFSLNLDGVAAATQYKGFPLEMLAKQAGDKVHFENCPFCEKKMKVFDLPGKIVCSGCGNVKICGTEHNHTPEQHTNSLGQERAHTSIQKQKSMKRPAHQQPTQLDPISATQFIAGFLL